MLINWFLFSPWVTISFFSVCLIIFDHMKAILIYLFWVVNIFEFLYFWAFFQHIVTCRQLKYFRPYFWNVRWGPELCLIHGQLLPTTEQNASDCPSVIRTTPVPHELLSFPFRLVKPGSTWLSVRDTCLSVLFGSSFPELR